LVDLVKRLTLAEEERNRLIHSSWHYTSLWGASDLMRTKAGQPSKKNRAGKRNFVKMTAEDIQAVRDKVATAIESLTLFTLKYIQEKTEEEKVRIAEY